MKFFRRATISELDLRAANKLEANQLTVLVVAFTLSLGLIDWLWAEYWPWFTLALVLAAVWVAVHYFRKEWRAAHRDPDPLDPPPAPPIHRRARP